MIDLVVPFSPHLMDKDTKFALLVVGLPLAGLIYCGIIIALLLNSPLARDHPLFAGLGFGIVPIAIAATIWIRASAQAYQKGDQQKTEGQIK